MENKTIVSIYIDKELKEELKKEAKEKHLNLNTYLKLILYARHDNKDKKLA